MSDFTLSIMPPAGRGCGKRKKGGEYGCMGTSPDGTPIWDFLLDPVIPWMGDKFRGIHEAPPEMVAQLPDDWFVVVDMIGMEHYPTVPSFIEETGRFGLSRNMTGFDWSRVDGRTVMLVPIHWRAFHTWSSHLSEYLLDMVFKYCKFDMPSMLVDHYADCLYWLWPLTWEFHQHDERGRVEVPWGTFSPFRVISQIITDSPTGEPWTPEMMATQGLPQADYGPGMFAAFPITHVEVVGYVQDGSNVHECGLPVVVTEE